MTDVNPTSAGSQKEPAEAEAPIIRDKRRLDPQTGQVRNGQAQQGDSTMTQEMPGSDSAFSGSVGEDLPGGVETPDAASTHDPASTPEGANPDDHAADLQDQLLREKADFHNYRELMKRERPKDREQAIASVVEALLPVLDDLHLAREHGDLAGTPLEKIAEKIQATLGRFGVSSFGAAGESFDPTLHEALMHVEAELPEGSEGTTIVQVMQPGYKVGERVVRAARVSVADPS